MWLVIILSCIKPCNTQYIKHTVHTTHSTYNTQYKQHTVQTTQYIQHTVHTTHSTYNTQYIQHTVHTSRFANPRQGSTSSEMMWERKTHDWAIVGITFQQRNSSKQTGSNWNVEQIQICDGLRYSHMYFQRPIITAGPLKSADSYTPHGPRTTDWVNFLLIITTQSPSVLCNHQLCLKRKQQAVRLTSV